MKKGFLVVVILFTLKSYALSDFFQSSIYNNSNLISCLEKGNIKLNDDIRKVFQLRIKYRNDVQYSENAILYSFFYDEKLVLIYAYKKRIIRAEYMTLGPKKDSELYFSDYQKLIKFFE